MPSPRGDRSDARRLRTARRRLLGELVVEPVAAVHALRSATAPTDRAGAPDRGSTRASRPEPRSLVAYRQHGRNMSPDSARFQHELVVLERKRADLAAGRRIDWGVQHRFVSTEADTWMRAQEATSS